jgi:hypothetical protein
MKPLLFLSLLILQLGCKSVCPTCDPIQKSTVFNGVNPESDAAINTANLSIVANPTVERSGDDLILKAKITCKRDGGNNDAWGVKLTVLIPAEVYIKSYTGPNACLIYGKPEGITDARIQTGYITFEQNHLPIGESIDIQVNTSKSSKTETLGKENFAIFAYSRSADLMLCDNYWSWKSPNPECFSKK